MSYPGHALLHVVFLESDTKLFARVLETSITVKQRMGIWLKCNCFIKSVHDQRIIVMIADLSRHAPAVIEIQNSTQIDLVDLYAAVILEFGHIRQPLFVRSVGMKVPVQIVPCDMCRIIAVPGAALRSPLDRRLNVFFPTDPQDSFIINSDAMLFIQFIPDPAISHIGMGHMDAFDLLRDLFVILLTEADWILQPSVVSTAGKMQTVAEPLYGIMLFF